MVNLVRSGTKQPQPISASAADKARLFIHCSKIICRAVAIAAASAIRRFLSFYAAKVKPIPCYEK